MIQEPDPLTLDWKIYRVSPSDRHEPMWLIQQKLHVALGHTEDYQKHLDMFNSEDWTFRYLHRNYGFTRDGIIKLWNNCVESAWKVYAKENGGVPCAV